jgi:epoxyqueuosine reductase
MAEQFRQRFRHTPLWRAKRRGLLRNAAIVLGNRPSEAALPALIRGLSDEEPLVRGASAWAIGQCGGTPAREALTQRLAAETDDYVRGEIAAALKDEGGRMKDE